MPLKRRQKRMRAIVARFQEYVRTYSDQAHYDEYRDGTFMDDMLYGIGIAIEPEKWREGSGFEAFKETLRIRLGQGKT
jgi:hypothetical protein